MGKLTALSVKSAKTGRHSDGDGLYLLVKPTGSRSWLLRVQSEGKRRDIGLGSVDLAPRGDRNENLIDEVPLLERRILTLAEAREKASCLRRIAKAGRDPIAERDKDRRAPPTFAQAVIQTHEAFRASWSTKEADAFLSSLKLNANPILGSQRVDLIEASDLAEALRPIWSTKPELARKVRQRINKVLDFSKANRWRSTEAPRSELALLLGKLKKRVLNFPSMPYSQTPAYFRRLEEEPETIGRLALMFIIASAARSGEVRKARWSQIDERQKLWNRPAEIMKSGQAHSVTLGEAALAILDRAKAYRGNEEDPLVFPSPSRRMLSDMTISKVMRDANLLYVPHGFRSSFRDWAAERMPHIPDPVAEAALAHTISDKVIAAYKRTRFLEMRRQLLDAWNGFLRGNVVACTPEQEREAR